MALSSQYLQTLIQKLQNGDENAFAQIYDAYSDSLFGIVLQIVKDEDLAADILQDSFIAIWKMAPTFQFHKGSFFTWMLNITRNKAIDGLRKINRDIKGKTGYTEDQFATRKNEEIKTNGIGLKNIIANLTEEQQQIIEYIYFRGYTQQEASEELDLPLGTVKTKVRLALKVLKNYFNLIVFIWIYRHI